MPANDRTPASQSTRPDAAAVNPQAWLHEPAMADLSMIRDLTGLDASAYSNDGHCMIRGRVVEATLPGTDTLAPEILEHLTSLLAHATHPMLLHPQALTIEAMREAIALMESLRGCIALSETHALINPVSQRCTLGHALSCDTAIWLGSCTSAPPDMVTRLRSRIAKHVTLPATLDAVLDLRSQSNPATPMQSLPTPLNAARRAVILTPPDCDPRVLSQWERLANDLQSRVRIALFPLPDHVRSLNTKGVTETLTWQTGVDLNVTSCVDFTQGYPRPGSSLTSMLARDSIDLLIHVGHGQLSLPESARRIPRVTLGIAHDPHAELSFRVPGIAPGLHAHVMRSDGITLRLWSDRTPAIPDPAARLLQQFRTHQPRVTVSP